LLSEPSRPPRPRLPTLSNDVIDALIRQDPASRRIDRVLEREQRKLRRLTSDAAWHQYLQVESVHMERALRWLELGRSKSARRKR
jgi:hypothetical protein